MSTIAVKLNLAAARFRAKFKKDIETIANIPVNGREERV
jgi:hypothetical protein